MTGFTCNFAFEGKITWEIKVGFIFAQIAEKYEEILIFKL